MSDPLREALETIGELVERELARRPPVSRVALRVINSVAQVALAASPAPVRDGEEWEYRVARWDEGEEAVDWSVGFATAAGAFEELPHAIEANRLEPHPYDHVGVKARRAAGPWVDVPAEGREA